jgi:hypothetical protein
MAKLIDFDAFGPPEQFRVREQLVPSLEDKLGLRVSSRRCGWSHG